MFSKIVTSAAVAIAASALVSAQTFTDCNPLEKTCPAEPAFGKGTTNVDFTAGSLGVFDALPGTTVDFDDNGALFSIEKESNAPTIATHKRIFFGRLDVELQAAPGQGIVTSIVLESSDLDEIDWEWVGGDDLQVQSNYFGKGDVSTYDRSAYHPVSSPTTTFHTYSIEWTSQKVDWIIDGAVVRTLLYSDAKGGTRFPQTPMEVKIGTWVAGGKNSAEGTVKWAGGYTDFTQAPFNAYYKSVSIVDYAGGDKPTTDSIKEYVYGDNSGSWESIEIVKGESSDDEESTTTKTKDEETATTKAIKPTSTSEEDDETTTTETSATETTEASASETNDSSSAASTATDDSTTLTTATMSGTFTTGLVVPTETGDAPPQQTVPESPATSNLVSLSCLAFAGAAALLFQRV